MRITIQHRYVIQEISFIQLVIYQEGPTTNCPGPFLITPALNQISIEMCQYFENYNLLLNTKFTVWDLVI